MRPCRGPPPRPPLLSLLLLLLLTSCSLAALSRPSSPSKPGPNFCERHQQSQNKTPSHDDWENWWECCSGYELDSERKCVPTCNPKCVHGNCSETNKCTCGEGYEHHRKRQNECVPLCSGGCPNGECVRPNSCKCNSGYEMRKGQCVRQCPCGPHGECNWGPRGSPPVCDCEHGYAAAKPAAGVSAACLPVCVGGCEGGACVAPDDCQCPDGTRLDDGGACAPVCEPQCVNGRCDAPQRCVCHAGYRKLYDNATECQAECAGCDHGDCVAPGRCVCHAGFRAYNATSRCVPHDELGEASATERQAATAAATWLAGTLLAAAVVAGVAALEWRRRRRKARATPSRRTYRPVYSSERAVLVLEEAAEPEDGSAALEAALDDALEAEDDSAIASGGSQVTFETVSSPKG